MRITLLMWAYTDKNFKNLIRADQRNPRYQCFIKKKKEPASWKSSRENLKF